MYRKYFVYLDDGKDTYRIAVAAVCEDSAKAQCMGNGEIIAVKDVTDSYPISVEKVRAALTSAQFGEPEMDFICRTLSEFEIAV